MDINSDNLPPNNKIVSLIKANKKKIIIFIGLLILLIAVFFILQINKNKKNMLFSEKYMDAQILLSDNKNIEAKNVYEELIKSKNRFYSVLALNTIIENDLEKDSAKILDYFKIVEKIINEPEQKDLIYFKKALYLIKISKISEGKKILRELSDKDSKFKFMADEILAE